MPQPPNTAVLLADDGKHTVTRDQVARAMEKYDQRLRKTLRRHNNQGFSIVKDGKSYKPKWILKLATGVNLPKIRLAEVRKTLSALGIETPVDPEWHEKGRIIDDDGDVQQAAEEAVELTFDIERDLQRVLRDNIEQLEPGLKITDGGKEKVVAVGKIDITAEDRNGVAVVIELKTVEADHSAIGQILAYMGDLAADKKPTGADRSTAGVRGILVAKDFSQKAIAAARVVHSLQLKKYNFKFAFESIERR